MFHALGSFNYYFLFLAASNIISEEPDGQVFLMSDGNYISAFFRLQLPICKGFFPLSTNNFPNTSK